MDKFLTKLCDSQYNLGIKHVFEAFKREIDENWTDDFHANAQYLIDKVKERMEYDSIEGEQIGRFVGKED